MKHYTFTAQRKQIKYGQHIILRVYQIKNNVPVFVGDSEFNTGSMKGCLHECLDILLFHKHITKRDYNKSEQPGVGPGYYVDNKKFIIHELWGQ